MAQLLCGCDGIHAGWNASSWYRHDALVPDAHRAGVSDPRQAKGHSQNRGKASYLLVPFIILSTLNLTHLSLKDNEPYTAVVFSDLALMINATVLFGIIYGIAIYYRKDPLTHARYMFCTIFPMFTPITDRLIYRNIRPLVEAAPTIDGSPIVPFWGFLLALILVGGLAFWDWKSNKRTDVFPAILGMLVLYHISVFTFHMIPAWRAFGEWFLGLSI
ncbi:hypothetical protein [Gracilimonas mengyeensis]|uniref:hypothetical protein n=1 Tax=Gracilimonas mengyeensis TaxID=1302730 RepID=UPI0011593A7A|nr:hypothetical protein [Gracilimonas mengyeensis]